MTKLREPTIQSNNWDLFCPTYYFSFSVPEGIDAAPFAEEMLKLPGVKAKKGYWEVPYNAATLVDSLRKQFGLGIAKINHGRHKSLPDAKEEDWPKLCELLVQNGVRPEYLDGSLGFPLPFQKDGILMGWNRMGISYWYSTGAGKTYTCIMQALRLNGPVVFVTRSGARIQMSREIERFVKTRAYILRAPSQAKTTAKVDGNTWVEFVRLRMPVVGKIKQVAEEWKTLKAEKGEKRTFKAQTLDEYLEKRKESGEVPFIVVGWEALPIHLEKLISIGATTAIFDEAHLGKGSKRNDRVVLPPLPDDIIEAQKQIKEDTLEAKAKGGFIKESNESGFVIRSMYLPVMNRAAAGAILARHVQRRMGLSVGASSIIVLRGDCFGTGWCGSIQGAFELASSYHGILMEGDYHLVHLTGKGVETRGWEEGIGFKWVSIKTMIAHEVNEVGVSCRVRGLELQTTGDHSLYVQRKKEDYVVLKNKRKYYGRVDSIPATDLTESDLLLGDRGSLWEEGSYKEVAIDAVKALADHPNMQVALPLVEEHRNILLNSGVSATKASRALCRSGPHGKHLHIKAYNELRDKLNVPGKCIRVYSTQGKASSTWVGATLLWSDLAYLLGVYIGNGWFEKTLHGDTSSMGLSVAVPKLEKIQNYILNHSTVKMSCTVKKAGSKKCVEMRVTNNPVMVLLGRLMGNIDAKTKYIPHDWLFTWPKEARIQLLDGMIDTDGHRGDMNRIHYVTSSPRLRDTLCVLLTSLGIPWSVSCKPAGEGGLVKGRRIVGSGAWSISWAVSSMPWDTEYPQKRKVGNRYIWDENTFNDVEPRDIKSIALKGMVYDIERESGHPSFTVNNVLAHNTATPVAGFFRDLWAQLDLMEPNAWGNKTAFMTRYCDLKQGTYGMIDKGASNTEELMTRVLRTVHRVPTHISQASLLNKKRRQSIYVSPEDQNMERAGFNAELKAAAKRGPTAVLETRLAQAATRKRIVGVELITENLNSKQKVVVFTARIKDCMEMYESLKKKNPGVEILWANGELGDKEKQVVIDTYMKHPGPCCLVATGQALGASIDLHDSDALYFIMLPYEPISLKQWEGRVVRLGMQRSVIIYYLIAEGTIDEHVASLLIDKLPVSELIADDQELGAAERHLAGMDKIETEDEFAAAILAMLDGDGGNDND